jgi:hypothetical protein
MDQSSRYARVYLKQNLVWIAQGRENSGRPRSKRVAAGSLALYKTRMKNPRKGRGPAEIGANAVMV